MLSLFWSIGRQLTAAYLARDNAKTDSERAAADVQIKALETKLASRDNRLLQFGLGLVALAMCAHAAAVAFVSMIPVIGWNIDAMPPAYAAMQQSIILSGFGLAAVGRMMR